MRLLRKQLRYPLPSLFLLRRRTSSPIWQYFGFRAGKVVSPTIRSSVTIFRRDYIVILNFGLSPKLTVFLFWVALSCMLLLLKCLSWSLFSKAWVQSQGEVQKSGVLSDHLNYNILKVVTEFFPDDTKNKMPTPALKLLFFSRLHWEQYQSASQCENVLIFWKDRFNESRMCIFCCLIGVSKDYIIEDWVTVMLPIHCVLEPEVTLFGQEGGARGNKHF